MTTSLHSCVPVYPNTESLSYQLKNSAKYKGSGRIACKILKTFRMLCYFNTEVSDAFITPILKINWKVSLQRLW